MSVKTKLKPTRVKKRPFDIKKAGGRKKGSTVKYEMRSDKMMAIPIASKHKPVLTKSSRTKSPSLKKLPKALNTSCGLGINSPVEYQNSNKSII